MAVVLWTACFLLQGHFCSADKDCAALASAGDCEFYKCLDEVLGGCGSGEYPLGFGYKYCRRFLNSKEMFDQEAS